MYDDTSLSSSKQRGSYAPSRQDTMPSITKRQRHGNQDEKTETDCITKQEQEQELNEGNLIKHAFPTNPLDHCETPFQAYQDLNSLLMAFCKSLDLNPSSLKIWDPYFCNGMVKEHLDQLGFTNVRNENRDFYQRIKDNDMPEYDMILTNPPYSDDHVDKLLQFCKSQSKPFALLMPNWVARKKVYGLKGDQLFYLSPTEAYTYIMPSWAEARKDYVGDDGLTRPYVSSWYIGGVSKQSSERFHDEMDRISKNQSWVVAKTIKGLKWKIQKKQLRQRTL